MAYFLNLKVQEQTLGGFDLWPKIYESKNPHTKEVVRYEFKNRVDFDLQYSKNPEIRKIFKPLIGGQAND